MTFVRATAAAAAITRHTDSSFEKCYYAEIKWEENDVCVNAHTHSHRSATQTNAASQSFEI